MWNPVNTSSEINRPFIRFIRYISLMIDGSKEYRDYCLHLKSHETVIVVVLVSMLFIPLSYMAAASSNYDARYLFCFIAYLVLTVLVCSLLIIQNVNKLLTMTLLDRYASTIYSFFLLSITTVNGLFLLFRVQSGTCKSTSFQGQWSCNPLTAEESLPLNSIVLNMWITIAFIALFRCIRWSVHLLIWVITLGFLFTATVLVGKANFSVVWIANISYLVLGGVVIYELKRQSLHTFKIHKLLEATIDELVELKESEYAEEMRHLIANVAHDLKTVSI